MKQLLITIAGVVLVGCGEKQSPEPPVKAPNISIHDAAKRGNIEAVKQHLAAGTDVDARDGEGVTPLNLAALMGHKEIVGLLIAKGADVNTIPKTGFSTLQFMAIVGHNEIAELLIANGADLDVSGKEAKGNTSLHFAADNGRKEIAELLVAGGADVNAKDRYGQTPLDSAIMLKHAEITDLLRKHGGKTGEELEADGN